MKNIILFILISFGSLSITAQNDSYTKFTEEQKTKAISISKKLLNQEIKFEDSMDYEGSLFWYVLSNDGKEYYFNSTKTFTEVTHEESSYSSLMEYVIETIGF